LADYFGCGLEIFGMRGHSSAANDARSHPLVAIRKLTALSTAQLAKALGEKESDLAAIETGRAALTEKLLLKICRVFQIDPEDLAAYAPALSPEERVMLLRIRGLTPAQRRAVETLFRKFERETA
jgi:transcriptional regulator with XRE-family HTH domain